MTGAAAPTRTQARRPRGGCPCSASLPPWLGAAPASAVCSCSWSNRPNPPDCSPGPSALLTQAGPTAACVLRHSLPRVPTREWQPMRCTGCTQSLCGQPGGRRLGPCVGLLPHAHTGSDAQASSRVPPPHPRPLTLLLPMQNGCCKRGDACPFAHGVFECWLHPTRYRTQVCACPGGEARVGCRPSPCVPGGGAAAQGCRRTQHVRCGAVGGPACSLPACLPAVPLPLPLHPPLPSPQPTRPQPLCPSLPACRCALTA